MRAVASSLMLALAGCGGSQDAAPAPDLERAAIARGLVTDPDERGIVGLYARDTDRLCIVPDRDRFRVGAYVDYGDGIACNAAGSATRTADRVRIDLGQDCAFEARADGTRVVFPGQVPAACARLCNGRASLAALDVARLSDSASEATAMRDGEGRLPCATS